MVPITRHRPSTTLSAILAALLTLALLLSITPAAVAAGGATADTGPSPTHAVATASVLPSITTDPAEAAAGWLVSALTDDPAVDTGFGPSAGPTIDVLFALAAAGVAAEVIEAIADWLTTQAPAYTTGAGLGFDADDAVYAGATAKLALAMLVVDRDPRDVAGVDLIARLQAREVTDATDGLLGRFTDRSDFGDFSTPLTQSLALLALERAGATPSPAAVAALTDQACEDGGIPSSFRTAEDAACTASVDTTGYAVQALLAVGAEDVATEAVAWLVSAQATDGSFASGDGTNTNSAGLAAVALSLGGEATAAAAARAWILTQQEGCDTTTPGAIPFNLTDRGVAELSTAQAIPGLVGIGLSEVDATGASATIPALLPFSDVVAGSTHAPAICALAARDVAQGYPDGTFRPAAGVTRGQAASLLAELLDLAPVDTDRFSDVAIGDTHAGAIGALLAADIVTGRQDGTFGPGEPLRRDQAASLLARALELELVEAAEGFSDVTPGSTHAAAIDTLAAVGVVQGTSADTFSPAETSRRDRFATLLVRAFPAPDGD